MECPRCRHDVQADAALCVACGTTLGTPCPGCGALGAAGDKFCGQCGRALGSAAPAAGELAPGAPARPPAERRQLTVMFCDLVGSTALSQMLDAEQLAEVISAYQDACERAVTPFAGYTAQYQGDGVLVYFGYPHAHEDDAERAVHAALGIVARIEELNAQRGLALAVRTAIHTGVTVVGDVGAGAKHELLALGDTPVLAAQLQQLAEPGTVVISGTTHRLVQGLFRCADLGEHVIGGATAPVRAYRVIGDTGARNRFEAALRTGLTPLVGRDQEIGVMLECWRQASKGAGQVLLLEGAAGIGKSRLVEVMKASIATDPHLRWECRGSPYFRDSAFHPVIDLCERGLQFRREDSAADRLQMLTAALERNGLGGNEPLALWSALLSLPLPEGQPLLPMSPARQKEKTLGAILQLLGTLARRTPVLVAVEDLHWVDPSTLELLDLLVDRVQEWPVCLVLTFRPEFRAPWRDRPWLTRLRVDRLSPAHTELMVARVVGAKPLPDEVVLELASRTDGVPLFVEELTKMVLESGLLRELPERYELAGPLPRSTIPATLHDSLMARLDGLPLGKRVAQVGATLGRSFSDELVRAVMDVPAEALEPELRALVDAEILYQRGTPPGATYVFKHALIQEAAYQSLLRSRRQHDHARIARVLAERFPEVAETQPELLAHHCTEANLPQEAIRYWQRAGQLAMRRSANAEAVAHLTRGLTLIRHLEPGPARDQQELELHLALGTALVARQGYGAPEVAETLAHARRLLTTLGESPQLFPVRWALWRFYLARADFGSAGELAAQLLAAPDQPQPGGGVAKHVASGVTAFYLGEFARAREHLVRAVERYDPAAGEALVQGYGQDLGIGALGFLAWTEAVAGDLATAAATADEALRLARQLGHPFTLALACLLAGEVRQLRREPAHVLDAGEQLLGLAREHAFPFFQAFARMFTGWAGAATADAGAGVTAMQEGAELFRSVGQRVGLAHRAHLAEALLWAGQPAAAAEVASRALGQSSETGEAAFAAELHRIAGQAYAQLGSRREAERCLERACEVATAQGAWLFVLRAACAVVRLDLAAGAVRAGAREQLAQACARFSPSLDVADLHDARTLLAAGA